MAGADVDGRRRLSVQFWQNSWVGIVVAAAVAVVGWSAATQPFDTDAIGTAVALTVLAVGYEWLARVEVLHRRINAGPYVTMDSVWFLAAVCVLPLPLTACVIAVIWSHATFQARKAGSSWPIVRDVFNICAAILPAAAVTELIRRTDVLTTSSLRGPLIPAVLIGAVLIYAVFNSVIVAVVIAITTGERRLARLAGSATENLVEIASLCLGVLVGLAFQVNLWLALLALPILVLLQRIALVEHLESAANEDGKTGLLNAAAWNDIAERDLERAKAAATPAAVMVVDLDHFKRVNDTYGHLTGDVVLRSVAECMRAMLRDRDQVARFGGEEFVAFLPGADAAEALKVAERLRQRIADTVVDPVGTRAKGATTEPAALDGAVTRERVRITVSIGVAALPEHGETLVELLARADEALYAAKNAGRNRIQQAA